MSTALQILNVAYRDHNMQEVNSFSTAQEFPYNIAKDILNEVIRELNRLGNFWFAEQRTVLPYYNGYYEYSCKENRIDPRKIISVRRQADDVVADLQQYNWPEFQRLYRTTPLRAGMPTAWTKFGDSLMFDVGQDQSYDLNVYHYRDMPLVTDPTDSQETDTILVPENDEDLLERGCYFYLGYKLGKWDYGTALAMLRAKAAPFLVNVKNDSSMPSQMPASF